MTIREVVVSCEDGSDLHLETTEEGYSIATDGFIVDLTEEEMNELRDALNFVLDSEVDAGYDAGYADGWNDAMEEPNDEDLN